MNKSIEILARKITEGHSSPSVSLEKDSLNIYHRPVNIFESSDISYIIGLLTNGLRASAILESNDILANLQALQYSARVNLPLVINIKQNSGLDYLIHLKQMGYFILMAGSAEEEINLTILAHKIAETAMVPGAVVANYPDAENEVSIPQNKLLREFLGNPDDHIDCPTPAQSIIFGKHRRRVPNWFNPDIPVMIGARKSAMEDAFEKAAKQKYFLDHLPGLISSTLIEFNNTFGTSIEVLNINSKSGSQAVITLDQKIITLHNAGAGELKDIQLICPVVLSPFPNHDLIELLKGKKSALVLEGVTTASKDSSILYMEVQKALSDKTLFRGLNNQNITMQDLINALNGFAQGETQTETYLGFDFTRKTSEYPTHEALLQEIDDKYPELINQSINERPEKENVLESNNDVPLSLRHYQDKGPNYSRLSRFYNNVAVFYDKDNKEELVADPFSAVPVIPASTAEMMSYAQNRKFIPEIDVKNCSGQGESILLCPHSALLPVVINVEGLINTGIKIASEKGLTFNQLTPMVKNLGKVAQGVIKNNEIEKVGDFLNKSFEKLAEQLKLSGDKKDKAANELNCVLDEISEFPVAKTDVFFNKPNAVEAGTGELFSMVVNPRTCTGCSICIHTSDAITMAPQTDASLNKANKLYNIWQYMPNTPARTIKRLIHDDSYDSLTAISLGRNYHLSMTGANHEGKYDAQKTILHLLTTATESITQARVIKHTEKLDDLIHKLSDQLHHELSQLLPKENIESIAQSLKSLEGKKVSLHDVVDQIPESGQKSVDSQELKRRALLVDELKRLRSVYINGPSGQGRSRYSLVLSGKSMINWAGIYPYNHFTVPVVIDWDDAATDQVLGLMEGQVRYVIDNIKLLRRAELEINKTYDPDTHDNQIAELQWDDLSEEEKSMIPPVLLAAEWHDLNSTGWGNLSSLLLTGYPIKVIIFENLVSGKNSVEAAFKKLSAGLLNTIALKNPFVFQGSIADTRHLFNGFRDALERTGTAMMSLYHTDFNDHGISTTDWKPYSHLARDSRTFPCLSYDPKHGDGIYGTLNIDGNRNPNEDWHSEKIILDDLQIDYYLTWADWAFTQPKWRNEFNELDPAENNVPVSEFLKLELSVRKQNTPVIIRESSDGLVYYSVSNNVIRMTELVLDNWLTLQELSGIKAEIPQKLKQQLSYDFEKKKIEEIEKLKQEHAKEISDLEANQIEAVRQQLKEKLVSLAKMARKN